MSKIQVDYLRDKIAVNHVHTLHFISLYRGYIYEVSTKDLKSGDTELGILDSSFANWAGEEILRVGLIILYHHWEKSICALLTEQGMHTNIFYPCRRAESINNWARNILGNYFDATVDEKIWDGLEELRRLVNALKHADFSTYIKLANDYSHYFINSNLALKSADDFANHFVIGETNYDRLSAIVALFWETLPYNVNYAKR